MKMRLFCTFGFVCAIGVVSSLMIPEHAKAGSICPAGTHYAGMENVNPDPTGDPVLVPLCMPGDVATFPYTP